MYIRNVSQVFHLLLLSFCPFLHSFTSNIIINFVLLSVDFDLCLSFVEKRLYLMSKSEVLPRKAKCLTIDYCAPLNASHSFPHNVRASQYRSPNHAHSYLHSLKRDLRSNECWFFADSRYSGDRSRQHTIECISTCR